MADEIEDIKPNIGFYNPNIGVYNPNQRQFIEDELRYREKLQQLHTGRLQTDQDKLDQIIKMNEI